MRDFPRSPFFINRRIIGARDQTNEGLCWLGCSPFFVWASTGASVWYGMGETIYLYKEIIKDLAVLVVALVLGLVGFCAIIFLIIFLFI